MIKETIFYYTSNDQNQVFLYSNFNFGICNSLTLLYCILEHVVRKVPVLASRTGMIRVSSNKWFELDNQAYLIIWVWIIIIDESPILCLHLVNTILPYSDI